MTLQYLNLAFCLTYGDGVSDVNTTELISFHKACVNRQPIYTHSAELAS